MERKLASIQRVRDVRVHPNADALDLIMINDWQLCAKRGEFTIGDLAVYMEIDSILPERPEFEFMRQRKFRVKTIRLRGELSQGIAFPVSILPTSGMTQSEDGTVGFNYTLQEDEDVTVVLGIVKYEPTVHASLGGTARGGFPSFLHKTDEERVQNMTKFLPQLEGVEAYITEKLDGSNFTCYLHNGEFGVASRNLDLKETEGNAFWRNAREMNLEYRLKYWYDRTGVELALQGEMIGDGIQKNKLKINGQTIRFYNVFDISNDRFLDFDELVAALELMDLRMVPVIDKNHIIGTDAQFYINMVNGVKSVYGDDILAEGYVIRPKKEMFLHRFGRVSFKAISNAFLEKFGD